MEEGFRERAKKVVQLLGEPTTRFVLITSPRRDAVEEARFFAEKIGDHNLAVDALIVNRVHPRFGTEHSSGLRARAVSLRELRVGGKDAEAARERLAARYDNLADFNEIAERERSHLETVRVRVGSAAVAFVPYLAHDVYDFDALAAVGQLLFSARRRRSDRCETVAPSSEAGRARSVDAERPCDGDHPRCRRSVLDPRPGAGRVRRARPAGRRGAARPGRARRGRRVRARAS